MTETNDPAYPEYGGWTGWTQPLPDPRHPGAVQPGAFEPPPTPPSAGRRLGARLRRRPTPRFSIVLAGAGAALLLAGALYWAGGFYGDGLHLTFDDDGVDAGGSGARRFLGVVLFLGIAGAG